MTAAIAKIQAVTDLRLSVIADNQLADISYSLVNKEPFGEKYLGALGLTGDHTQYRYQGLGPTVFSHTEFYNPNNPSTNLKFHTSLHELVHSLGGIDYASASINSSGPDISDRNSAKFSILSYNTYRDGLSSTELGVSDVWGLQVMWGRNTSASAGDDYYETSASLIYKTVWDAKGKDTLSVATSDVGALIDLQQGHFSSSHGHRDNLGIAYGAVIEEAIGSGSSDLIIGNAAKNKVYSGDGDDVVFGSGKVADQKFADIDLTKPGFSGLARLGLLSLDYGVDLAFRTFEDGWDYVDLNGDKPDGDSVSGDELYGEAGEDRLYGGDGDDTLDGGADDDWLSAGKGSNKIHGGDGFDYLDYRFSDEVRVMTMTGVSPDGGARFSVKRGSDLDHIEGIEMVELTGNHSDTVFLKDLAEAIFDAESRIDMGKSGTQVNASGERMIDTINVSLLTSGVIISMADPLYQTVSQQGASAVVRFRNAEGVVGTAFGDVITGGPAGGGDAPGIVMVGAAGRDTLTGGSGEDRLIGGDDGDELHGEGDGSTSDRLDGGAGGDQIFAGAGDVVINPDAGDRILFDGSFLKGAFRPGSNAHTGQSGTYYDSYADIYYDYDEATKTLVVRTGGSPFSHQITLTDFVNGEAGINLRTRAATPVPSKNDSDKPPTGSDPLVLDLDGDGIELTPLNEHRVYFDLSDDGLADRVGWVAPDDGLLARDVDGDGRIVGQAELFGTSTIDGFVVLSRYDSNLDGVVNSADEIWSSLRIWRDADTDGDTDAGELQSLTHYGITSISLNARPVDRVSSNNVLAFTSTYDLGDGAKREIASAYLQMSQADPTETGDADYPDAVYRLPQLELAGLPGSLHSAAAADPTLLASIETLVLNARNLSSVDFRLAFTDVLLRWAGVQAVDPGSAGEYADARHVAFLEVTGAVSPFLRQADGTLVGGASSPTFGPAIERAFDAAVNDLLFRFGAQLATSEGLLGIDVNATATGWFAGLYNGAFYDDRDILYASGKEVGYHIGVSAMQVLDQVRYLEVIAPLARGLQQPGGPLRFEYGWDAVESDFGAGLRLGGLSDAALIEFATDRLRGSDRPIQIGTSGSDYLYAASARSNMFLAGRGDDAMMGSEESDGYLYSLGDGNDVIAEVSDRQDMEPATRPVDRLLLVGINRADVDIQISPTDPDDVVLSFSDGGAITLTGQLAGRGIEEIVFANGDRATAGDLARLSLGTEVSDNPDQVVGTRFDDVLDGLGGNDQVDGRLGNDTITGGSGDDLLVGNAGDDTYVYEAGDGDDVIDVQTNDAFSAFTNAVADFEVLVLRGVSPSDVTIRQNANGYGLTYLFGGAQPGGITVLGERYHTGIDEIRFDDGTVWGPHQIKLKMISDGATNGDDTITGTEKPWFSDGSFGGQDDLAGGKGDDVLQGLSGRDTYRYRLGDGADVVIDDQESAGDNLLILEDLNRSDISFSTVGGLNVDLLITVNRPEGGSIRIKNSPLSVDELNYTRALSGVTFADGSTMSMDAIVRHLAETGGTAGDDRLLGSGTGDVINGLGGDDYIFNSGAGVIDGGDGDDVIVAWGSEVTGGRGDDDISRASRIVYRTGDGHDTVRIDPAMTVALEGVDRDDVTFALADGRESLVIQVGGQEAGSLKLVDVFEAAPTVITFGDGTSLTIGDVAELVAPTTGTGGNDVIIGVASLADTIDGLAGDDDLSGGNGSDTYVYRPGEGDDVIHDAGFHQDDQDKLVLRNFAVNDVTVARDGDDAVLTFGAAGSGSIRLTDQFANSNIESIEFDDGRRWFQDELVRQTTSFGHEGSLLGTAGDDTIDGTGSSELINGAEGDDVIRSRGGNDVIVFNPGDGHDFVETLRDLSIVRLGVSSDDVSVIRDNLPNQFGPLQYRLQINSTGETITFAEGTRTPFVEFADGVRWSPHELLARVTVFGTSGSDQIDGHFGPHAEIFDAGGGPNDVIRPGGGSDTFKYQAGGGFLTIEQSYWSEQPGDLDTLELRGIAPADVVVSLERGYRDWGGDDVTPDRPTDLVFRFRGIDGAVIVKQAFHEQAWMPAISALERVRFDDGTVWDTIQIAEKAGVYGTAVAEVLFSSDIGSGVIEGGGGADRILDVTARDEVRWSKGDGDDRVSRIKGPGTLVLVDVDRGEATFTRQGGDLLVSIGSETITIVDQLSPTYSYSEDQPDGTTITVFQEYGLALIKFADGLQVTRQELYEQLPLMGTGSSDYLDGSRWAETIIGLDDDDRLAGKEGDDVLDGGQGRDRLLGGDGDDVLTGGGGGDELNGGAGSDTYEWRIGDGDDYIRDKGGRYQGTDTLRLVGVSANDIELARIVTASVESTPYDALRITIKSTGEVITIDSQYLVDMLAEQFLGSFDGYRDDWDDSGGLGEGPMMMMMLGGAIQSRVSGDLGESSFTMSWDADGPGAASPYALTDIVRAIERIVLDDGTVIDPFANGIMKVFTGTDYDDQLQGTSADDAFAGGIGSDLIDGRGGDDTASYGGVLAEYRMWRTEGGEIAVEHLVGYGGLDTLTSIEHLRFDDGSLSTSDLPALGTGAADVLIGTSRADVLFGFGGDDLIAVGLGDDFADGGDGLDQASYVGSSTDFLLTVLEDGTLNVLDLTGVEGNDYYANIESVYFAADGVTVQTSDLFEPTGSESMIVSDFGDGAVHGLGEHRFVDWSFGDPSEAGFGRMFAKFGYAYDQPGQDNLGHFVSLHVIA
jgi:Ca2+-binding RTX toxin-like protein